MATDSGVPLGGGTRNELTSAWCGASDENIVAAVSTSGI
jgi:hypothetical protein